MTLALGMLLAPAPSLGAQVGARPAPGRVTTACAEADAPVRSARGVRTAALAVRVRIREPRDGVAESELTGIANTIARKLAFAGSPPARSGTFAVVLDDLGGPHYFTWLRQPRDTAGAKAVQSAVGRSYARYGARLVPTVPVAPLALEIRLDSTCR